VPDRAYRPAPGQEETRVMATALDRVAEAASDDPRRYSFALIASHDVSAYTVDAATFYFTEGLARQPAAVVDALVAHEVAHALLGHRGQRRSLSLGLSAGFTVLGLLVPATELQDLLVSPLVVRVYPREQELAADRKAVELLHALGYGTPRRTLAAALGNAAATNGSSGRGWLNPEPGLEDRLAALEPLEPVRERAAARAR
jgi:Zn-dependent protease with chaperone function